MSPCPEAIEHFTAAIGADPANHVFYSNRSAAAAALEKFDDALVRPGTSRASHPHKCAHSTYDKVRQTT